MIRWRHEHEQHPARLARRAATTRLGAQRTRLETVCYRRCARGDTRCRQPVAQEGALGGRGGIAAPSGAWADTQAQRRATGRGPGLAHPWTGGVRVPRPGVDLQAGGGVHPAYVCRHVPPRPRQPPAACAAPQRPATGRAGRPAQRDGNCGLVAGPLASRGKKATEEGRTIVWVDQAGFYLLPMAVRTWAPCRHTPILRVRLTHDHLAAIGGLTPDRGVFLQKQEPAPPPPHLGCALSLLCCKIRPP